MRLGKLAQRNVDEVGVGMIVVLIGFVAVAIALAERKSPTLCAGIPNPLVTANAREFQR